MQKTAANILHSYNTSPLYLTIYDNQNGWACDFWQKKTSLRMLLAQAFRTSSMAERYIKFEQGGGPRFLPNPNLNSEKLVAPLEVGGKWDISEKSSLDASAGRLNDNLAYKVKHSFSIGSTKYVRDFTLNLNARYRSRIKEVFIYPGSEPAEAFLVNAKVAWYPFEKGQFYLAFDNISNAQYEELERYPMPGRSFTAGAVWDL